MRFGPPQGKLFIGSVPPVFANSVNSHSWVEGRAADGDLAAAVGASGSSNWPISVSGTGVDVPYSAGQVG